MKKSYLKSIYKFDKNRDTYVLEISIDTYQELFNEWDASPIRKKDIDPDLAAYLQQVGIDIPLREDIDICFIIPKEQKDEVLEVKAQKAFTNYYNGNIHFINRTLRSNFRKTLMYLVLGFSFIALAYVLTNYPVTLSFDIIKEGLFIGGWVFLWEAISLFFFVSGDMRKQKRQYKRFASTIIHFVYL